MIRGESELHPSLYLWLKCSWVQFSLCLCYSHSARYNVGHMEGICLDIMEIFTTICWAPAMANYSGTILRWLPTSALHLPVENQSNFQMSELLNPLKSGFFCIIQGFFSSCQIWLCVSLFVAYLPLQWVNAFTAAVATGLVPMCPSCPLFIAHEFLSI